MTGIESRHELFQAARRRAQLSVQQLWLRYLALTGTGELFDLDAFLHGLAPLPPAEQDVLAAALNERLVELGQAAEVPYLFTSLEPPTPTAEDPLQVLDQLLLHRPQGARDASTARYPTETE